MLRRAEQDSCGSERVMRRMWLQSVRDRDAIEFPSAYEQSRSRHDVA